MGTPSWPELEGSRRRALQERPGGRQPRTYGAAHSMRRNSWCGSTRAFPLPLLSGPPTSLQQRPSSPLCKMHSRRHSANAGHRVALLLALVCP